MKYSQLKVVVAVNKAFGSEQFQMLEPTRRRTVADARKAYCVIVHRHLGETLDNTGKSINRDHSSVVAAIRQHEILLHDKEYRRMFSECVEDLKKQGVINN